MFCPRCGQEQVSENTRFCSRCGFLLETISEVLANGGVLPQLLELGKNKKFLSRKNGIKFGVMWAVVLWLLVPILGIADAPDALIGGMAVLGFAGAVIVMLIAFFFLDNTSAGNLRSANLQSGFQPKDLRAGREQSSLPPSQSQPIGNYTSPANNWKTPQTGEFAVKPPSVTEETTKLLQKDE